MEKVQDDMTYGSTEGRTFVSYAVGARIEPGNLALCSLDKLSLTFQAKKKELQIIANVYNIAGKWLKVEHYHEECYEELGMPYGMVYERGRAVRTLEERIRLGHPLPHIHLEPVR